MEFWEITPVTAKDVLRIFYSTPSKGQLMKICELGIVKPYREATGTGSNRLFDWYNLLEIGIWRELHVLGMDNTKILEILNDFRNRENNSRNGLIHNFKSYIIVARGLLGATDQEYRHYLDNSSKWKSEISNISGIDTFIQDSAIPTHLRLQAMLLSTKEELMTNLNRFLARGPHLFQGNYFLIIDIGVIRHHIESYLVDGRIRP